MSLTTKSFEQILSDMKAENKTGLNTEEGSFVDAILRPVAYVLAAWNYDLAALAAVAAPDTAVGEYLDRQAKDYGLTRKPGTKATAEVTFAGAEGVIVPAGTAVQTQSGLVFFTDEAVTVTDGTAIVGVTAEYVGTVSNVQAGAICVLQSLATVTVENSTEAVGGTDTETDDELRQRLAYSRANLPASGNAAQYESWAMEVPGVGRAKAFGRWNGPGTVKIVLLNGVLAPADEGTVADVQAYIEPRREICTEVTCVAADRENIDVSAEVVLKEGASIESVQKAFGSLLDAYLAGLALTGLPIVYNRVVYMLLSVDGVADFLSLTVNGGTENIAVKETAAPMVGTVTVT